MTVNLELSRTTQKANEPKRVTRRINIRSENIGRANGGELNYRSVQAPDDIDLIARMLKVDPESGAETVIRACIVQNRILWLADVGRKGASLLWRNPSTEVEMRYRTGHAS